jgi:hypothetical protein
MHGYMHWGELTRTVLHFYYKTVSKGEIQGLRGADNASNVGKTSYFCKDALLRGMCGGSQNQ